MKMLDLEVRALYKIWRCVHSPQLRGISKDLFVSGLAHGLALQKMYLSEIASRRDMQKGRWNNIALSASLRVSRSYYLT